MSNKKKPKYIQDFERSTKLLIDMFCKKQEVDYEFSVSDDITGVSAYSGHNYFSLNDVYFDMVNDKPKGLIIEWQQYISYYSITKNVDRFINYESYCLGARFEDQNF